MRYLVLLNAVIALAFVAGCNKEEEAPPAETPVTSEATDDSPGAATFGLTEEGKKAGDRIGSKL